MVNDEGSPETLADVIEYNKVKLAPMRPDPRTKDHWFDEVKDGFDSIWCAVARLELMLHCGMTSDEVGGPVLVNCADKDKIARQLKEKCPDIETEGTVLQMMYIKKPPPGAPPW
ncbi:hypothetical protein BH24GEM1_BH24GEM1_07360 [soil metagenome]|nr:hypothetical protein [Gemmatimonadales bacterium]